MGTPAMQGKSIHWSALATCLCPSFSCICLSDSMAHQQHSSCSTVFLKTLKLQAWNFTEKEILICKYHHPSITLWPSLGGNPGQFPEAQACRSAPCFTPSVPSKERSELGPDANIILTLTLHNLRITQDKSGKEKTWGRNDVYHMYQTK